jgi:hypothetical protein
LVLKLTLCTLLKILTHRWEKLGFDQKSALNSQIQKTIKGFIEFLNRWLVLGWRLVSIHVGHQLIEIYVAMLLVLVGHYY